MCSLKIACELVLRSIIFEFGISIQQSCFLRPDFAEMGHNSLVGRYLCFQFLRIIRSTVIIVDGSKQLQNDSFTNDVAHRSEEAGSNEATYWQPHHEDWSCDYGSDALLGSRVAIVKFADCYSSSLCFKGIADQQCYPA